jgi:hypothetical protein
VDPDCQPVVKAGVQKDMRRVAVLAGTLALTVNIVGSARQNKPADPPPGRLVDVGGRRLHLRCVGPAGAKPSVILEAGAGDYSNRWNAVQDLLAPRVRSCAYDRAGMGWSAGSQNQSMSQDNDDLRALLKAADVAGPSVLVGHIHVENPKLVAGAIEEVVTAVIKGTKLRGA